MHGGGASTPFELSRLLAVDTGLMTRLLDKLEARGLLERSRSNEDRRVVNLSLTAKGSEVAAQLPGLARNVLNPMLRKFSKREFEQLRSLLLKFVGD
jgi:DNA-binding MarR family transcriptional regulator